MARFECKVISYVLNRTVEITVVIPTVTIPDSMGFEGVKATHVIKEKYPVLYLLHGMGNNHGDWCSYSNVEMFAEEHYIAVVMISGENKFYRNVPEGDEFFRFLEEEVPEFITNMFPVSDKAEHTYIAGLSMGGYGALLHGLSRPEKFAAIGAFSGAINVADNLEIKNSQYDCEYLLKQIKLKKKELPPIYLACGTEDILYQMNVDFKDLLLANEAKVTWVSVPGYGHEWRFWNLQAEEFLKWIPRSDGYANRKVRIV
ncbi:alpha/beta hydrolase [Anaerocolumna jejuensis]|uniref:alpha/beta hydrolase n=1 Tax=Anaerocolumna jejuensis TaxID=259063 RepID=UPI003F7B861F